MTRDDAIKEFKRNILPLLRAEYGHDIPAVRQAWNNFTDTLRRDGLITDHQVNTWVSPVPQMAKAARATTARSSGITGAYGGSYTVFNDDDSGEGNYVGVINLMPGAHRTSVEAAMSTIGIYAPRGADRLEWKERGKTGVIRCASGDVITFSKNGS